MEKRYRDKNKIFILFLVCLVPIIWVAYAMFGHYFISIAYKIIPSNILIKFTHSVQIKPLEHYFRQVDLFILNIPHVLFYVYLFVALSVYLFKKTIFPQRVVYTETNNAKGVKSLLLVDIAIACFLLLACLKLTNGIERLWDIRLFDESYYLYGGVRLLDLGLPNASCAPLYHIWYFFLSLFIKNKISLYFLNYKILFFSTTFLLYILLRRINIAPFVAVIATFFFIISGCQFVWPWMIHFAVLIWLLTLIFATLARSDEDRYLITGLGCLFLALVRPEYISAFILMGAISLFFITKMMINRKISLKKYLSRFFLFVLIATGIFYYFGSPFYQPRAWGAFTQCFVLDYAPRHHISINPWTGYAPIINAVFYGANTLTECINNNPKEFFIHVFYNVCRYPFESAKVLLMPSFNSCISVIAVTLKILELLFIFIAIIYVSFTLIINVYRKSQKIYNIYYDRTLNYLLITFLVIFTATLTCLVTYPLDRYLVIQAVMIIILTAYLVSRAMSSDSKIQMMKLPTLFIVGLCMVIFTPTIDNLGIAMPNRLSEDHTYSLETTNTIKFIESLNISKKVNMLEAEGGYYTYLTNNFFGVAEYSKAEPFNEFVKHYDINMIVISDFLKNDGRFINDPEFKAFLENPDILGFHMLKIPNTHRYLLVRENLIRKI